MVSTMLSHNLLAIVLTLFLQLSQSLAQNGDGGGVPISDIEPTSAAAANAQGASGAQGGSVNLTTGLTVAIAVIVGAVIVVAGKSFPPSIPYPVAMREAVRGTDSMSPSLHNNPLVSRQKAAMESRRRHTQIRT